MPAPWPPADAAGSGGSGPEELEELARGRFVRLVRQRPGGWEYADRVGSHGVVAVVAVTPHDELVLCEQARPPVGARVLELPAGLAGDEAPEGLAAAAARELREETGFEADRLEPLFAGPPSAGLCSEVITVFRARGLRRVAGGGGVGGEDIAVRLAPLDGLRDWLRARAQEGILLDPKIAAGVWWLERS